jgi:AraC-like DNA-binding protein
MTDGPRTAPPPGGADSTDSSDAAVPRLLAIGESRLPATHRKGPEPLAHWELTVVLRGRQEVDIAGRRAELGPAEACLAEAGALREEWSIGDGELHRLQIVFAWSRAEATPLPLKVQDSAGRLHELCSWLLAERDALFPAVNAYRGGLLRALLAEFQRLSVVAASRIEEKTRTYMLRHLGEAITLDDLANNIGMSRYYFCRVYKEVTQQTPMEHLRALRLERARDLIRSTALPLKAIAPEVGFGSAQHLCRLLHDRFGVGVRELRANGHGEWRVRGTPLTVGADTSPAPLS